MTDQHDARDAAAKKLAECMDYPWEHMPAKGREAMRQHAQAVIDAYVATQPTKPEQQAGGVPAGFVLDWSQAGRLMEAAMSAKSAGFTTGTTNWAAHICRAMDAPSQSAVQPLSEAKKEPGHG